jgi:membrane protease YdiL (CAAX protease family)
MRPWTFTLLVWVLFLSFFYIVNFVAALATDIGWIHHAALKLGLIAIVFAWARLRGLSWDLLGLHLATKKACIRVSGAGFLLGVFTSIVALLTGNTGMSKVLSQYSFPQLVLWIWIISSVSEELFCRGWFQGQLSSWALDKDETTRFRNVVLPSAVLFGGMHLPLLWSGVGLGTALLIVTATTLLGLLCADARERTGSILPACGSHISFNVGGVIGGIIYVGCYFLINGHLPVVA